MKYILGIQNLLIGASLLLIGAIPIGLRLFDAGFAWTNALYAVSLSAVFLLMTIRPLADITGFVWLRRLVILRKGLGILSASIIVGLLIDTILKPGSTYLTSLFTLAYYSLDNYALLAHLGDLTAVILLMTSNVWAQKLLKRNWKRIQRLSYVYFYAGALYEYLSFDNSFALYTVMVVTNLTVLAWLVKKWQGMNLATLTPYQI